MPKTTPLRITTILPSISPGGAEFRTIDRLNELAKRGIDLQLIILSNSTDLRPFLDEKIKIDVVGNPNLFSLRSKSFASSLKELTKVRLMIKRFNPSHIIASLPISHFIGRLAVHTLKKKPELWIYHHSTEFAAHPPNTLFKKLFHQFNCFLSRHDTSHLYISDAVKKDIESNFPVKTGEILYNALPKKTVSEKFEQQILKEFQLETDSYIIIPGRLHPVKGHSFFIQSCFDILKDQNLKLVIAGYGDTKSSIEEVAQSLSFSDNITITGELENPKMLALIKGAKLVVIPSIIEGLGNVAIEALMMGKLILASDAGGLAEVITDQENGYSFPVNNKAVLREKLKRILNDWSAYNISSDKLIKDFEDRFSIKDQIDKLILLFEDKVV